MYKKDNRDQHTCTDEDIEKADTSIELGLMQFINLTSQLEESNELIVEILNSPVLKVLNFPDFVLSIDMKNFLEMSLVRSIALRNLYQLMLDLPNSEKKKAVDRERDNERL